MLDPVNYLEKLHYLKITNKDSIDYPDEQKKKRITYVHSYFSHFFSMQISKFHLSSGFK